MEPDFSGWATKAGLVCSDGRTIMPDAFKHMDGVKVPLVWQHGHDNPENILGHAVLKSRDGSCYAYCFWNDTPKAKIGQQLVEHGDIESLSIYANKLKESNKKVSHGMIREVSLVLSGANEGAKIDFVSIKHSDGDIEDLEDEAVIHMGLPIDFDEEVDDEFVEHADDRTVQQVIDSMDDMQKKVLTYMVGLALEGGNTMAQSSTTEGTTEGTAEGTTEAAEGTPAEGNTEDTLTHQEGTNIVKHNVFETQGATGDKPRTRHELTHDALQGILKQAKRSGQTLKSAFESYAEEHLEHGINDIDLLFPDAKMVTDSPEFDKRRTEWVRGVINGTRKSPFSRVKSLVADLTQEQARARGYIKGTLKKEEWFGLTKRETNPTTIYKKQKLDRDDIIDIVDLDVVAWMKGEMRLMLEEELATAILIGDGRTVGDDDKILDPAGASSGPGLRSILNDDDLYTGSVFVNLDDASSSYLEFLDLMIESRHLWKGTGTPTFYTTQYHLSKLLILRDADNHRMFRNMEELRTELMVDSIVVVETMEREPTVIGILVNLQDYNIGADKGGEINLFDDFDIDYNQFKYLIETRLSGALVKIRSALVFKKVASTAVLVTPVSPGFAANVITPATTTGVTYKRADTNATVTTGAPITLDADTLPELTIYAIPASASYYFANNVEDQWTFNFEA